MSPGGILIGNDRVRSAFPGAGALLVRDVQPVAAPDMERVATTILLADPDPDARAAMMWFLLSEGFWVEPVATGLDAVISLENQLPDLALIDLGLPGFNGHRLIDLMRNTERLVGVPIIATAVAEPLAALPKNVPFLRKPCDLEEVLTIIGEQTGRAGKRMFTSATHPFPAGRDARRFGAKIS